MNVYLEGLRERVERMSASSPALKHILCAVLKGHAMKRRWGAVPKKHSSSAAAHAESLEDYMDDSHLSGGSKRSSRPPVQIKSKAVTHQEAREKLQEALNKPLDEVRDEDEVPAARPLLMWLVTILRWCVRGIGA